MPIAFLLLTPFREARAQLYPVQTTLQLTPPYSVYLSDYASPGNDKLRLIMVQRDVSKPSYQVRLSFSIELNGQNILRTSQNFNPGPIVLDPGIPMIISGLELQPYLDSRNLDFFGYSREKYEQTKALPEGNYQICVTAYDFRRPDVAVSDVACSFYWLAKNEPPIINQPFCGSDIPIQNPQQILFSWLPRNTSSPGSVNETEYEFSLYEIRPQGRNPNDVVLSSKPIFETTTEATQLVYGPAGPILLKDLTYAWRVQAIDKKGRDQFRNSGYSEVCTFSYGGVDVSLPPIEGLSAEAESERRGKAFWQINEEFEEYKVGYKKQGAEYQWFTKDVIGSELTLYDLEPDTQYQVRVQGKKSDSFGLYSDVVSFKTQKPKVYDCGDLLPSLPEPGSPLLQAQVGTVVDVHGLELTLTEVVSTGTPGLFNGSGRVSVSYLGGAAFNATFDRLFIDENRVATSGRIDFITKSIDSWVEEKLAEQKKEELAEQQSKNREEWAGTDFYDEVTYYDDIEIEDIQIDGGKLVIEGKDASGNNVEQANNSIIELANSTGKAVIIEDKNGDQWVVQPGGKVSKVPGGGLSPTMDVVVSREAIDFVEQALLSLRAVEYADANIEKLAQEVDARKRTVDAYVDTHNAEIVEEVSASILEESGMEDSFLFDFEEMNGSQTSTSESSDTFSQLRREYCEKQRLHDIGLWIQSLTDGENIKSAPMLIASEIVIVVNGSKLSVTEFISQQKNLGVSDNTLIDRIKLEGITELLTGLVGYCR
jgi:hypothetical protein